MRSTSKALLLGLAAILAARLFAMAVMPLATPRNRATPRSRA